MEKGFVMLPSPHPTLPQGISPQGTRRNWRNFPRKPLPSDR